MPFGLKNAPSVFQRLMQQVLAGVNPENGPSFVAAYIDDLLIFSVTLQEHLDHLRQVIHRLREVGLKVNPGKCQFIRSEVEYLGHVITPEGLRPNSKLVEAVRDVLSSQECPRVTKILRSNIILQTICQPLCKSSRAASSSYLQECCI